MLPITYSLKNSLVGGQMPSTCNSGKQKLF